MARRSRRQGGVERRDANTLTQRPWAPCSNPLPPIEPLNAEGIERIHDAAMRILEEIGMVFLDADACAALAEAGAIVDHDSQTVRMGRDMVEELVAKAPAAFTLHARNPARNIRIGGNGIAFSCVSSPPNCSDLEGGRRPGNFEDFSNLMRLAQSLEAIHLTGGYPVEPQDIPPESRHLDCVLVALTETDKAFGAYALGAERISDAIDMACLARGRTRDEISSEPSFITTINTSSPLRVDGPMLRGMKEAAQSGQVPVVTPFTLAGAMSPVTLAGAIAQQNAEALAVIAYHQLIAPGAPVIYGAYTSNVDMKSGAPAFGTPEYVKTQLIGGQLARRYGLPYRTSNCNAANTVDEQATWESMMSLWGAVMGHGNLVKHAAGWLEGGLCASFEKMVLDAELLQHMMEFVAPVPVTDADLAVDAIREVGAGGHFFGTPHTLERYETAFYAPMLSDWRNFESWREAGAESAAQRAHGIYKRLLAEFEPPAIDPGIKEALTEFVERRKREIKPAA